jgi:translation initiation factor IF-3
MNNPNIRVITESGTTMVHTLDEAQRIADEAGLDLVEVSENVYKVMDYKKFLYNRQKAQKKSKQDKHEVKECQFTLSIADNDRNRKITDIIKWLNNGNNVRIIIKLRGREAARPEYAVEMMQNTIDTIAETVELPERPKIIKPDENGGRNVIATLKAPKS